MTRAERERRALFADGMTPAQQRRAVLIAQDVLRWLQAGRMEPRNLTYLSFDKPTTPGPLRPQLRELATRSHPCAVCAEGALFIASVDRFNQIEVAVVAHGVAQDLRRLHLSETFSTAQLIHIEAAFECWERNKDCDTVEAGRFGQRFKDARRRMRAIMRNIIENRGVFVPPAIAQEAQDA